MQETHDTVFLMEASEPNLLSEGFPEMPGTVSCHKRAVKTGNDEITVAGDRYWNQETRYTLSPAWT